MSGHCPKHPHGRGICPACQKAAALAAKAHLAQAERARRQWAAAHPAEAHR